MTLWARSLVSVEAVVGVLYITIIMARLVVLYATTESTLPELDNPDQGIKEK